MGPDPDQPLLGHLEAVEVEADGDAGIDGHEPLALGRQPGPVVGVDDEPGDATVRCAGGDQDHVDPAPARHPGGGPLDPPAAGDTPGPELWRARQHPGQGEPRADLAPAEWRQPLLPERRGGVVDQVPDESVVLRPDEGGGQAATGEDFDDRALHYRVEVHPPGRDRAGHAVEPSVGQDVEHLDRYGVSRVHGHRGRKQCLIRDPAGGLDGVGGHGPSKYLTLSGFAP